MRVISAHHCVKRHRNSATLLRCRFAQIDVAGTGQLALFIHCGDLPRALLSRRLQQARTLQAEFDVFGCSPTCTRDHELVAIDLDPELRAQLDEPPTWEVA